jgi:hypothetical protein
LSFEGSVIQSDTVEIYIEKELDLTVRPPERVGMGIGAGGNIIQHVEEDVNDPRIWDMANSKVLNIQIINSIDFEAVTGIPPPPTPITPQTYTSFGLPFYELYRDKPASSISGPFGNLQTVGQIEQNKGKQSTQHAGIPTSSVVGQFIAHQQAPDDDQYNLHRVPRQPVNIIMLDVDSTIPVFKGVADDDMFDEDEDDMEL